MMENVPRLRSKGRALYSGFKQALEDWGYVLTEELLEVADFGVPQLRKRVVLLAGRGFQIPLPKPTHTKGGSGGGPAWRTVREAIGHLRAPETMAAFKAGRSPEQSDWHVVRVLSKENVARIKAARPGGIWSEIPERLRPPCHRGGYLGFRNVYGRMQWEEPAPTITGGCTTFSKGRFGHPDADRTISVRAAALLQTFPADYRIDTPYIDHACEIIGNALPCLFRRGGCAGMHKEVD
jgi:DNA (cytosine-5)-methyltransferase 1